MLKLFLLYFYTIKYLRPTQVLSRFWFIFRKPRIKPIPCPRLRKIKNKFVRPACRRPSLIGGETFFFLNEKFSLSSIGWYASKKDKDIISKLWRYNQHYFDDLNALNSSKRKIFHYNLIEDWVNCNSIGTSPGWEPYTTSLRIVNWIKWHLSGNDLSDKCLNSLAHQGSWLVKRIEWHLMGNHLFANAKALIFLGIFFEGKMPQKWLKKGLNIIEKQLDEQILDDGGHFERSTMYHSIILEDILDLINLNHAFIGSIPHKNLLLFEKKARKMIFWLKNMIHSDGEISFFNDASIGICPAPKELFNYAKKNGILVEPLKSDLLQFANSGYIKVNFPNVEAFIDVAEIGPDYLPAHGHADTLSFELSIFGERLIVNSGTYEYEMGKVRDYERSTAAHNTVVIDNQNSSEVWGSFRVARRAKPGKPNIQKHDDNLSIDCSHSGYSHLNGKPIHHRKWLFSQNSICIEDNIEGVCDRAFAYFHFSPKIMLIEKKGNKCLMQLNSQKKIEVKIKSGKFEVIDTYHSSEFGKRDKTKSLKIQLVNNCSRVFIDWS